MVGVAPLFGAGLVRAGVLVAFPVLTLWRPGVPGG